MIKKESEPTSEFSTFVAEMREVFESHPAMLAEMRGRLTAVRQAGEFASRFEDRGWIRSAGKDKNLPCDNPLWQFFQNRREGKGIWKWEHYFEIYHRHLAKFIGKNPSVLEVGVYSGGSLEMWHHYFGDQCHVHGLDIEEACRSYQDEKTTIHIGDQSDRDFWKRFHEQVPGLDVLIDDGGHSTEQQRITLEEVVPRLNPGGVYLCEDVTGFPNAFSQFACGLVEHLNRAEWEVVETLKSRNSNFQASLHSIHFYPFVVVIEKRDAPLSLLAAPKKGTEWQPFFD